MKKRLILILALAFVVGISFAAYAEVQNVKVSGDITVMGVARQLELNNNQGVAPAAPALAAASTYPDTFLATITRVRVDADLTDNVMATVRLLNERLWGTEIENPDLTLTNTAISLDLAYVTLKEFLYSPLTLKVGRQELHFGNDMIIGDVDTNNIASTASVFGSLGARGEADLTARKAFDAIRATFNYDPLVVDAVYAKISEGVTNSFDDIDLYGINAGYDLTKNTKVEGYWWLANQNRKLFVQTPPPAPNGTNKPVSINVVGGRIATKPLEALTYELEAAYQFGRFNDMSGVPCDTSVQVRAWALETSLGYDFKKVKYTPSLKALYAYFSGDSDNYTTNAGHSRAWQPIAENQTTGNIFNALFDQSNAHIVGLVSSAKATEDITLKGELYAYWFAKRSSNDQDLGVSRNTRARPGNPQDLVFTQDTFIGKELDITATYDYTEDVQFSLLSAVYWPGNALSGRNNNAATEVIGSMKVTF
jgi:hypothetical protein